MTLRGWGWGVVFVLLFDQDGYLLFGPFYVRALGNLALLFVLRGSGKKLLLETSEAQKLRNIFFPEEKSFGSSFIA